MFIKDHPRIHGEHCIRNLPLWVYRGSPPHTRGTHYLDDEDVDLLGITPAYTGNTHSPSIEFSCSEDHPRIHGEHLLPSRQYQSPVGSPPHTRGTLGDELGITANKGITPAYTGNTASLQDIHTPLRDHPRIHGEHIRRTKL